MKDEKLDILLIDQRDEEPSSLVRSLEDAGCLVVARVAPRPGLGELASEADPDVIVIDTAVADDATLDLVNRLAPESWPLVVFADESDGAQLRSAIQSGVAGFVVRGAQPNRVRTVLEVAIARFDKQRALPEELVQVKTALEDRKLLDRAKGLLMEKRSLSEQDAYAAMRKMAMDRSMRLVDVARRVIELADRL